MVSSPWSEEPAGRTATAAVPVPSSSHAETTRVEPIRPQSGSPQACAALTDAAYLAALAAGERGPVDVAELHVAGHAACAGRGLRGIEVGRRARRLEREVEAVRKPHAPLLQRLVDRGPEPAQREVLEVGLGVDGDIAIGDRKRHFRAVEEHGQRAALAAAVGARQVEPGEPVQAGRGVGEAERHRVREGRAGRPPRALGRRVGQGVSRCGPMRSASTSTAVPSTSSARRGRTRGPGHGRPPSGARAAGRAARARPRGWAGSAAAGRGCR